MAWLSSFTIVSLILSFNFTRAEGGTLPAGVARAAGSVFRMVPLTLGEASENSTAEQRRQKLAGDCQDPHNFIGRLRCEYMRDVCAPAGDCKIPFTTSGTAFLVDDGSRLVTAFHVAGAAELVGLTFLGPSLAKYPKRNRDAIFAAYKPSFMLFDSDGEKVYDTRDYVEPHRFESVGDPLAAFAETRAGGLPAQLKGFANDFAMIQLRAKLGPGLKVSKTAGPGKSFWALGYPMRTEGRALNYDGHNIYANQGLRYDMNDCGKMFGFTPRAADLNYPLLFFGNDVVQGFSGGPLFDETGIVVGIISATLSDETEFKGGAFAVPYPDFKKRALMRPTPD